MLMEALPSVMCHDPLVIPSRSREDVSGVTGHNPAPSRAPCSYLEVQVFLHEALVG